MIKLTNITKIYDGKTVLDNFSAEFGAGAYCITGASGTGKTTLLHIIMGLIKPDSGEVVNHPGTLCHPSTEGNFSAASIPKFGAVFQEDRLCENLSAVKNVALVCPKKFPKERIVEELTLVGLGGDLDKQTVFYSGGMKRRAAIVRALITDADVIIMDEPLKGLDDKLKGDIISYIKERIKGKTFIFVSHDLADADAFGAELLAL
jgi:NitT/TauT family transport system ATP-binding protein